MAHNHRTNADGRIAFIGHNTSAWHELGTEVSEAMTAAEAMAGAGLDWTVTKEPLYLADGSLAPAYATMASDTRSILGVVGERYEPIQNATAFEILDGLTAAGQIRYKSAGALGKGERVWLLAHTPNHEFEIIPGDPITDFILLSNSHDGSSNVEARGTSITVVCQNTLSLAMNGSKAVIKVRHTASAESRLKLAVSMLADHAAHLKSWQEAMTHLASYPLTDALLAAFEAQMFGEVDSTPEGRGRTMLVNKLAEFETMLVSGRGAPKRPDTLYKAVQAYTEWSDWASPVRGTEDRSDAIVFGNAATQKTRALDAALALAI